MYLQIGKNVHYYICVCKGLEEKSFQLFAMLAMYSIRILLLFFETFTVANILTEEEWADTFERSKYYSTQREGGSKSTLNFRPKK